MREGATNRRLPKIIDHVNKVEVMPYLRESKKMFNAVEIQVEIVDKVIIRILVDDGSSINIMPAFTIKNLGLKVTHPSHVTLKCVDQSSVQTLGRIKDLCIQTG